jgi:hypothetical protein
MDTQINSQRVPLADNALMRVEWYRYFFAQFTKLNPTSKSVTQTGAKTTGVTLNERKGQIVMAGTVLNASASVIFTLTNGTIGLTDVVTACMSNVAGVTANAYTVAVLTVSAGSVGLRVTNITGGNLTEAPVVNFEVGA